MNDIEALSKMLGNVSAAVLLGIFVWQQLLWDRKQLESLIEFLKELANNSLERDK